MAILKHVPSKNINYDDVLVYYTFKHTEDLDTGHYEPILDENGLLQERSNCSTIYLTAQGNAAPPEQWAADCRRVNLTHGKNTDVNEIKNHTYIISHPAEDRPRMSMEDLLAEGKAFAQANLQGYGVLISVHRDTDNDHIHITINSVRELAREEQSWMQKNDAGQVKRCEIAAGGKHQNNGEFLRHTKDWLLEYTRQHDLVLEDNNAKADQKKAERRRQADVGGKKLTKHQRELREAVLRTAPYCYSLQELRKRLKEDYNITLKCSSTGNTISLIHPENEKAVRLHTLGLDVEVFHSFADFQPVQDGPTEQPPYPTGASSAGGSQHYESKPYVCWLEHRRQKNSEKAENILCRAEALATGRMSTTEKHYAIGTNRTRDLEQAIQRTVYAEQDLQAEADKLDIFLSRWQQYLDPDLSQTERDRHGRYLKWCGCDPDSRAEFEKWQTAREAIEAQKKRLGAARATLRQKKFSIPNDARKEEKNYQQWLRSCRLNNAEKAEDTVARAEALAAERIRATGTFYRREDFQELYYLFRKTTYVERDLHTEADKLDRILDRWEKYLDPALPQAEQEQHGNYLRWCGCNPDAQEEFQYLKAQREALSAQLDHIVSVREILVETAGKWRGWNEVPVNKLSWTLDQERALREQLKTVRANRIKLGDIAYSCHQSARRRISKDVQLDKSEYFRNKWMEKLQEEKRLQQQLREIRQLKQDAKRRIHTADGPDFSC